jgi:uncharacterized protein (TIGR02271 family)
MSLHKIKDFDPDYRTHFEGHDLMDYDLYAGSDKVGSIDDLLVDDGGKIRYLVVNTGIWILGKKVLLPIGRSRIDFASRRVVVDGLTRDQVEALPQYDGTMPVDYDYEEQVRGVYRPTGMGAAGLGSAGLGATGLGSAGLGSTQLENSASLDYDASLDNDTSLDYDRNTYDYDREPGLYDLDERNHQNLRLYQERLIANKTRNKTGEVTVGKHVETEQARVSVPVEKERVVIERTAATGEAIDPGNATFQDGEVARVEVYEETPDIRKEAFVREEVSVRKEVDRETVDAEETLRREELDVDTQGNPNVRRNPDINPSSGRNR